MENNNINDWVNPILVESNNKTQGHFTKEPAINVINKEELEERTRKVFHLLWETLARSFGPYGAPTIICNYPYRHVTKDGYTIMKSLSLDASETLTDQTIADMASDICGRLNYSVGDGTTSAIIATNSIYDSYQKHKEELDAMRVLPRDIIYRLNTIKDDTVRRLNNKVRSIKSDDLDELAANIRDVVYISSNGDEELTNNITELYRQLGTPAITCKLADDGITKAAVIDGYQNDLTLIAKKYFNDDNGTMNLKDSDVLLFSIKVTQDIYDNILKPLNEECRKRKRHLIVGAPKYDEAALINVISRDLDNEKRTTGDINMVLCTYAATSAHRRKIIEDFAILTDTSVIDRVIADDIINKVRAGNHIVKVLNLDSRCIKGTETLAINASMNQAMTYRYGESELLDGYVNINDADNGNLMEGYIRVGFVHEAILGIKTSRFSGFEYNESNYNLAILDAKQDLAEKEDKYKKLGTFNLEVTQAQQRLNALGLKMGLIEIGADSELSQKLLKDAADDAVKAAKSAFNYGVVLGCNVNLIQSLNELLDISYGKLDKMLITILRDGFISVYNTVMSNAFEPLSGFLSDDIAFLDSPSNFAKIKVIPKLKEAGLLRNDFEFTDKQYDDINLAFKKYNGLIDVYSVITTISLTTNTVYDVSKKEFNNTVINSAQTDTEILTATIDLIGLLITGNQMVVTGKNSF